MKKVVLLTGAGGFVGQAVLSCAAGFEDIVIAPLERSDAAAQVREMRCENRDAQISLLNLSWPSLSRSSASLVGESENEDEWLIYERWLTELIHTAAHEGVRYFQVGSGIEPYASTNPPTVANPYLQYARRKIAIWEQVQAALPEESWRLRLHFLFGIGELSHRVIPTAIRACATGKALSIGAPERRRCWLDVKDVALGLTEALRHTMPENWDICGSTPISFLELFSLIGEATGQDAKIEVSKHAVADAECPLVEPVNPAPFIPESAGEPDGLRARLIDYVHVLGN